MSFADCGRDVSLQDLAGDAIGVDCYPVATLVPLKGMSATERSR